MTLCFGLPCISTDANFSSHLPPSQTSQMHSLCYCHGLNNRNMCICVFVYYLSSLYSFAPFVYVIEILFSLLSSFQPSKRVPATTRVISPVEVVICTKDRLNVTVIRAIKERTPAKVGNNHGVSGRFVPTPMKQPYWHREIKYTPITQQHMTKVYNWCSTWGYTVHIIYGAWRTACVGTVSVIQYMGIVCLGTNYITVTS